MPKKTFLCNICGNVSEIAVSYETRKGFLECEKCKSKLLSEIPKETISLAEAKSCGSSSFCEECGLCDHVRKTDVGISLVKTAQTEASVEIPVFKRAQAVLASKPVIAVCTDVPNFANKSNKPNKSNKSKKSKKRKTQSAKRNNK